MISVPSDIMACFQIFLNRQPVQKEYQSYYQKWFRFYWDFCHKYHHPVSKHESLRPFIEKLRQKKQKDYQIKQASVPFLCIMKSLRRGRRIPNP